jgi:hypothetical protein
MERESACPVHFLWDGRGKGRWFVRMGFLGLLGAALLWAASKTFVVDVLTLPALIIAVGSIATYAAGQIVSRAR